MQVQALPQARVLDLGEATLLPGLIDSHIHLLLDVVVPPEAELSRRWIRRWSRTSCSRSWKSPEKRALIGAQLAREDLESGFTTARNLGHSGIDGDTALRDAINNGQVQRASHARFRAKADSARLLRQKPESRYRRRDPAAGIYIVDGPDGARAAVQKNAFEGIDQIKVALNHDIFAASLGAVAEQARRQNMKVTAHAMTGRASRKRLRPAWTRLNTERKPRISS
ncbi:Amidohydrolase family protein [Bradyrhizobium shewense]|uniref:Amidohydrolase family protein n=1 Tax=Bradyrhizobium shewense TaxID=1761772 RepID=A0A1C3XTY0_9BRAD|nr:Amidohydrolase family protein [Bradyrhizobium shewense]